MFLAVLLLPHKYILVFQNFKQKKNKKIRLKK